MKISKLVTLFSSLFVIYCVSLAAAWYGSHAFNNRLLEQEAIGKAVHWAEFIAAQNPQLKAELTEGKASSQTRDALELASRAGGIFRYKILNSNGIIVHASRPDDIGRLDIKPHFKELVRNGKTLANINKANENFSKQSSVVSEARVPLMESGRFIGAVQIHVDETIKAEELDWITHLVFWSIAALVLGIAMVWAFFVWRALVARDQVLAELNERELELKNQNTRFNTALENMSQGLCLFDAGQHLIVANKRYASIYGMSSEQVKPGTTLRQILEYRVKNGLYAGEDPEEYIRERLKWVGSSAPESKIQKLCDGRSIAITHSPISTGGWLTTHEDVTQRIQTSDLLRATIDNFPGALSVFDRDLVLTMANDRFYELLDLPKEILPPGCHYEDIVRFNAARGDYGAGSIEEMVRERLELARKFEEHSFERLRPDGVVLEIRGFPIPQGGFVTSYVDITERKDAEVLNLRLARIVEDSINEVFVFDAETLLFEQVNTAACRNLGYRMEELRELTPLDLKPEFTLEQFENATAPLKSGEKSHIRFQTIHARKDGSYYDADIVLQQIQSGGRPVFAEIIEDVTQRKKAEQELVEHRDHLQELVDSATKELKTNAEELKEALAKQKDLNKLQRQFVSMASHEFRTPLAIIDGAVQRLIRRKDRLTPEVLENRVKKIRSAVKTMTYLMESTLSAARMEAGKLSIQVADCDLRSVVLEVCDRQLELNENHKLACDLKELPRSVSGDRTVFEQIFSNLIVNAVKYSPEGPDLTIKGWCEGEDVFISVTDRGLGIGEEDLPNMFNQFFRAGTAVGIPGTGIGLALVKNLVELHDGSVSVESRLGEGSTFTVRLPIEGPDQSKQADTRAA